MKRALFAFSMLLALAVLAPVSVAQGKPEAKPERDPNRKLPIEWWGTNADPAPPKGSKLEAIELEGWRYWGDYNFDLGKWCKKAGLNEEAKKHFAETKVVWPDKYTKELAEETKGGVLDKASRASPRAIRAYRKYLENGLKAMAAYYEAYARQALAEGNQTEARRGANRGLQFHADQPGIRRLRGEENIDGLGWVPVERAKLLKKCVLTPEKAPKNPAAHDVAYARPDAGYIVNGKHFAFASTAPWSLTAQLAKEMDAYFEFLCAFFDKIMDRPDQKIGIFLYGDESEYARDDLSEWAGGHFDRSTGCVHIYRAMYEREMDIGMQHEVAHAILDYAITGRPVTMQFENRKTGGAHFWIKEGVSVYLESYDKTKKDQKISSLGRRSAAILAAREKCRNVESLLQLSNEQWARASENDANVHYAMAGALTLYCLHEKPEAYREKYFNMLAEGYLRVLKIEDFDAIFGVKRADFIAEFLKWFDDTLIKRCKEDMEKIPEGFPPLPGGK